MATIASLKVSLIADIADYQQKFKTAQESAEGFKSKMKDIGDSISGFGTKMSAAVTLPVVAGFKSMVDAASDMNETQSKVSVVFKDQADAVMKWSEKSDTAMGLSQQKALEYAGTFGNLFTAMGLTTEKSKEMSTGTVQLAADLGSFNNMDSTEVLEKLKAGLTGQTEPLKSLGVNINAATVAAKAMQMGIVPLEVDQVKLNGATLKLAEASQAAAKAVKLHGKDSEEAAKASQKVAEAEAALSKIMEGKVPELTAAQKAQATMALIYEQTSDAQGDFGRTSDGAANGQRILAAQVANASANLGQMLLPYMLQLINFLRGLVTQFAALDPEIKRNILVVAAIAAAIGPLLVVVGSLITAIGAVAPVAAGVAAVLTGPVLLAIAAVIAIGATLYLAWTNNWGGIQQKVGAVVAYVRDIVTTVFGIVKDFIAKNGDDILGTLKAAWNTIQSTIMTVVNFVGPIIVEKFRAIAAFFTEHKTQIVAILEGAWGVIKGIFNLALALIEGIIKTAIAVMKGDWKGAGEALETMATKAWDAIKSIFFGALKAIGNAVVIALQEIKKTVTEKLELVRKEFQEQFQRVTDFLIGLQKKFMEIGGDLVRGIIAGVKAAGSALYETITGILGNAMKGAKDFLGIKSPSRRAHEDIGLPFMVGIVNGIVAGEKILDEAMKRVSQKMMAPADGIANADSNIIMGTSPFSGDQGAQFPINIGQIINEQPTDMMEWARRLREAQKKRSIPNA